jgi:hypothetical protein
MKTTTTQQRTAKDPHAYVAKFNETNNAHGMQAEVVSIDGETKSGQKRYTLRHHDRPMNHRPVYLVTHPRPSRRERSAQVDIVDGPVR